MPDGNFPRQDHAVAEAEADFIEYARSTYEPTLATLAQAGDEIATMAAMAAMAKDIAECVVKVMARFRKLDMARDFDSRSAWRAKITLSEDELMDRILDGIDLGEGANVLREHARKALKSEVEREGLSAFVEGRAA